MSSSPFLRRRNHRSSLWQPYIQQGTKGARVDRSLLGCVLAAFDVFLSFLGFWCFFVTLYSDPVQAEYARLASQYDRRWSFYIDATLQATIERLEIQPKQQILDLGCGTGTLLRSLLHLTPDATYTGLDSSAEMLNLAQQKLPEFVELHLGNVEHLPFPDASFDLVISTSAFHYFRNPSHVLQGIKRVLKPHGQLVITDWCYDYWTCRFLDLVLRMFNSAHCHTYGDRELATILDQAGFGQVSIERYKINWFWGMMTAKAQPKLGI